MKKFAKFSKKMLWNIYIGIVGAGRVGSNVAYWLARAGWRIRAIYSRTAESAQKVAFRIPTGVAQNLEQVFRRCDAVFLTVPERVLPEILEQVAEMRYHRAKILVHMSGILPSRVLELAGLEFFRVAVHPLAGIPPLSTDRNPFEGVFFSIEGDKIGMDFARSVVLSLGGRFWEIDPDKKPIYHSAAAVGANAVFANIAVAEKLLAEAGFPRQYLRESVAKLIENSVKNYLAFGIPEGMTGPLTRDDYATLMAHIKVLSQTPYFKMFVESMRVYAQLLGKGEIFESILEDAVGGE